MKTIVSMDKKLALTILKDCYPRADNIRIIHDEIEDGLRHVTSDITRLIVEYEEDHKTRRSSVVMKAPNKFSTMLELCDKLNLFNKEIAMYETMIPRINQYLDKSLAPAHLYTTDSQILVLEDLTARGYKSGEKLALLNHSEAKGTLKVLAQFHAASHKLHEEDPKILYNLFESNLDGFDFGVVLTPWASVVLELLRRKNETDLMRKVEATISFYRKVSDKMNSILDKSNFKFVALNHGDGRKHNFLYKYSANDEVQVQFIDYQFCIWTSPAFDLIYFLNTSVSPDILAADFDGLIDDYLAELNMRLEKLECANRYGRADFDEDFKTFKFFIFFSFFCLCANTGPLNVQQIRDTFTQPEKDINRMCDLCLNDEQFVCVIYGWLKYFEKLNIADQF